MRMILCKRTPEKSAAFLPLMMMQELNIVQTNQRVLFDGQDDLITSYRLEAKDIFEDVNCRKRKRNRPVSLRR